MNQRNTHKQVVVQQPVPRGLLLLLMDVCKTLAGASANGLAQLLLNDEVFHSLNRRDFHAQRRVLVDLKTNLLLVAKVPTTENLHFYLANAKKLISPRIL